MLAPQQQKISPKRRLESRFGIFFGWKERKKHTKTSSGRLKKNLFIEIGGMPTQLLGFPTDVQGIAVPCEAASSVCQRWIGTWDVDSLVGAGDFFLAVGIFFGAGSNQEFMKKTSEITMSKDLVLKIFKISSGHVFNFHLKPVESKKQISLQLLPR